MPLNPEHQIGDLARRCWRSLLDIQYGIVESEWSVVVG